MSEAATPITVLNVNDDEPTRYLITRVLQQAGFHVIEAKNGREALALALRKPDLIVLDINLPDIDGVEICKRIKADPLTLPIPVLHVSATRIGSLDKSFALESGADGYLSQPFEPAELTATVHALLRLTQAEERARKAAMEWQTVFNAIGDSVCLIDQRNCVQQCNRAMAELVGLQVGEILGRSIEQSMAQAFPGASLTVLSEAISARYDHRAFEMPVGNRWLRVSTEPVPPELPHLHAGHVLVLTDITEIKTAVVRQRLFLRDILASVTQGKLTLCMSEEDLPTTLTPFGSPVALMRQSIRELRRTVEDAATQEQFPAERYQDLETAVGEAAMNAVVHAKEAVGFVYVKPGEMVQVWIQDRGEGISIDRLPQVTLERGYTTTGTLGHGFFLMLKCADRIWMLTGTSGTTIVLEQDREESAPSWLDRM